MRLHLDLSVVPPQLTLTESEDCTALSLELIEFEHAYIAPGLLHQLATESPKSPGWEERFAGMIAFAEGKGWVRPEDGAVRVHVE